MAQKANLKTLRNHKLSLNLLKNNPLQFLYGFKFFLFFTKLLNKRGVYVLHNTLNFEANKINFNLDLFFQTSKIQKLRLFSKKVKIKQNNKISTLVKKKMLSIFVLEQFKKFQSNFFFFNLRILNFNVKKKLFQFYYRKFKTFSHTFFLRRLKFFSDFLQLTCLLSLGKLSSIFYLKLLGQIFKVLPKKQHNRFFFFIKYLFQILIYKSPNYLEKKKLIKGIKFIVNGKLRGKTRASSLLFQIGKIPMQSFSKKIDFSKIHIYTVYGAFGFKLWLYT